MELYCKVLPKTSVPKKIIKNTVKTPAKIN